LLSVICSNFNGARFLPKLLASLRAQTGVAFEVIVVDRESTDGSAEILRGFPEVAVLSEPPQTGLVAGYHRGVAAARGEAYFFCNEDMWFAPDCLARLAAHLDPAGRVGAADPWQWTYDGAEWIHGCTRFTAARWAINSPHPRRAADFQVAAPAGALTPFGCAGAVLVHRDLYRAAGGWDPEFFLDAEDIDLFLRAWQRGWRCVCVPEARVYHAVNAAYAHFLTAVGLPVSHRRYISQRANLAVIALKYFSWPHVLLAALQVPVIALNNLLHGRGRMLRGDFLMLAELARRLPGALAFRRANAPYNHYFPGERFFTLPGHSR
jgi:GT2 family glycosyltransferase